MSTANNLKYKCSKISFLFLFKDICQIARWDKENNVNYFSGIKQQHNLLKYLT